MSSVADWDQWELPPSELRTENLHNFVNLGRSSIEGISGDVDLPPSGDELFRILECPVCAEFPATPIYSCANGHFICNSCILLLGACTSCGAAFTRIRNYALEAIVERTTFKCKYREEGCEKSVLGQVYSKHVLECLFRPLTCRQNQSSACYQSSFNPNMYLQHLITFHDTDGKFLSSDDSDLQLFGGFTQRLGDNFPTIYLKVEGRPFNESFLLHTKKHRSYVCWWVTSLTVKDNDEQATLSWAKFHPNATATSVAQTFIIKWKLPILHENQSFEEIRDSGACAVMPLQHLSQFKSQNKSDDVEICWILGLEIQRKVDGNDVTIPKRSTWNTIEHYSPLLGLIFIGIVLCIYFSLQDPMPESNGPDEFYGYRGFYFKRPTRSEF